MVFHHGLTPDFLEMLLHHIAHTALVSCAIIVNQTAISNCSTFLHSFSDIPLKVSKILYLLGYKGVPLYFSMAINLLTWPYFRLFCFPMLFTEFWVKEFEPEIKALEPKRDLSMIFSCCLLGLHIFWYFLMLKIVHRMVFKGEVKDTHNDLSKLEEKKPENNKEKGD